MTLAERFRRARKDPTLAVLEGFHALKHAIRFGATVLEAATADPVMLGRLARELAPDIEPSLAGLVRTVPADAFAHLVLVPQGTAVIALAERPIILPNPVLDSIEPAPIVLLDRPSHLGNVGAVVRVAAAAEAQAVVTTGALDPWHPAALRGSAGLHFALPVMRLDELPSVSREIVAFDPEGEPAGNLRLGAGAILAFGSERGGLSPELLRRARRRVAIPMRPGVSSLNLATAVAVVLYGLAGGPLSEHRQPSPLP